MPATSRFSISFAMCFPWNSYIDETSVCCVPAMKSFSTSQEYSGPTWALIFIVSLTVSKEKRGPVRAVSS